MKPEPNTYLYVVSGKMGEMRYHKTHESNEEAGEKSLEYLVLSYFLTYGVKRIIRARIGIVRSGLVMDSLWRVRLHGAGDERFLMACKTSWPSALF